MITEAQIAAMGADAANADVPFVAPEDPWKPWHSPVMVLAGCDGNGTPWLYLAARCGWLLGFAPQHSPGALASSAAAHIDGCAACQIDAPKPPKPAGPPMGTPKQVADELFRRAFGHAP